MFILTFIAQEFNIFEWRYYVDSNKKINNDFDFII